MVNLLEACADLPRTSIPAGQVLIEQGQRPGPVYVLVDGSFVVERGGAALATLAVPGSVVGEMSVLLQTTATATVRAGVDSTVVRIEDGERFLVANPEVTVEVARTLAARLDRLSGYLAEVKQQYADRSDHLGMIDQVLSSLLNDDVPKVRPGSARMPETDY